MLNPWMLLGLLGLAAPIIIHLIQQQRLRPQPLATLRFLDREDVANAFAPRPRDLLQLLLRLLLLALFVLLMVRTTGQAGDGQARRTLALVVDQSLSMQQRPEGRQSLFEHARGQVIGLLEKLGPEDRAALILVGDRVTLHTGFLSDRAALLAQAQAMKPQDGGALALVPAMRDAVNQLRGRHEPNAFVLVFSDLQQRNFRAALDEAARPGDGTETARFREQLAGSRVQLVLLDPGGDTLPPNLAISAGTFSPSQVFLGAGSKLTAEVHNYGPAEQMATLTFYEGESAGEARSVPVPPGGSVQVDLAHRFESPVDTACRAELADDPLPADNRFAVPMRMQERREVLLVAPALADEEQRRQELDYDAASLLTYALNPAEVLGQGGGTAVRVRRISPARLEQTALPIYGAIILHGVASLPPRTVKDLEAFVGSGGGLLVIPDRDLSPAQFNETCGPLLGGLQLGQLREPPEPQGLSRDVAGLGRPWLAPLLREEWGPLRDLLFMQYFSIAHAGTAVPLLRADNGDWLLATATVGRGRVVVQLFPGDFAASTVPRAAAFVPLVQELVAAVGRPLEARAPDVMRVGETRRVPLPEFRGLAGAVQATGPVAARFALLAPEHDAIRAEELPHAGAYELVHPEKKTGRRRWLAVNPPADESDLTRLSTAEQEKLFGAANVARLPFAEWQTRFLPRRELLPLLLALVALAFVVEAVAGAWQSRRGARGQRAATEGAA